ncbi:PREDICTED: uncharacterized protein LOC102875251 [Elephantulus edwardii]|uniref:uncharacterized protein LOC102875251 n=1 Tax=Elephantulus edwardii TaxID=28737 RepID=UPI0003F0DDFE|nr:PREDICTED: uncharacterized protein LOC102875251 [Elephantulus edwardii]
MMLGALELAGPPWGWDMDGDEDWDSAVLTLLALAVVAATALALHWFSSGQDQEMTGPANAAPQIQPSQVTGSGQALPPKKVSDSIKKPRQRKLDPPGHNQGSPVASGAEAQESCMGDLTATVGSASKMPGDTVSSAAHGQLLSTAPGTVSLGRSRAGGTSGPILIHFTPRDVGEAENEPKIVCPKESAYQAFRHTAQLDIRSWQPWAGLPHLRKRGRGNGQWQVDGDSGDRPSRPPRPDPLRLGNVVSVWDAVDAAAVDASASHLRGGCRYAIAGSPSDMAPSGCSQGPSEDEHLRAIPTSASTLTPTPTPTQASTSSSIPTLASGSTPASAQASNLNLNPSPSLNVNLNYSPSLHPNLNFNSNLNLSLHPNPNLNSNLNLSLHPNPNLNLNSTPSLNPNPILDLNPNLSLNSISTPTLIASIQTPNPAPTAASTPTPNPISTPAPIPAPTPTPSLSSTKSCGETYLTGVQNYPI